MSWTHKLDLFKLTDKRNQLTATRVLRALQVYINGMFGSLVRIHSHCGSVHGHQTLKQHHRLALGFAVLGFWLRRWAHLIDSILDIWNAAFSVFSHFFITLWLSGRLCCCCCSRSRQLLICCFSPSARITSSYILYHMQNQGAAVTWCARGPAIAV